MRRALIAAAVVLTGCTRHHPTSITVAVVMPVPAERFDHAELVRASRGTARTTTTTARPTTTTIPVAKPVQGDDLGVFEVTCYGPPDFPAGVRTSSGQPVGPGSIAADPALIPRGTRLHVDEWGDGTVNDTGGAIHGHRLDVWGPSHDFCVRWGRRHVHVRRQP